MLDLNRRSLIKGSVAAGVTALFGTAAQASTKVPAKCTANARHLLQATLPGFTNHR